MQDKVSAFWVGNVIGIVLLVGGIALSMHSKHDPASSNGQTDGSDKNAVAQIVCAKVNLPKGHKIEKGDLVLKSVKLDAVVFGTVTAIDEAVNEKLTAPVKKNAPINRSAFSD